YLESTDAKLLKSNDFGALLEIGAQTCAADEMNSIILTGKNIWSVYGILKKTNSTDENYQLLETEFMTEINTLRTAIVDFLKSVSDEIYKRFEDTYLGMNQGTIRNIVDLAHDLAVLKNLQNQAKYQ
ncbi:MAG: hypothetical protein HYZ54_10045, partial [Ignavibacteriae bacterium]|nr:hypothetical protein [Ignavibacteriota bacterium]